MIDKAFIDTHLEGLKECVKDASNAILEVYESSDFGEINKQDGSPWLASGETADIGTLLGMNFYVEGIEGDIPQ